MTDAVATATPAAPEPTEPSEDWTYRELWEDVREALFALPSLFRSELNITGVLAGDLFPFNSALGATIENHVVTALNEVRTTTWDRDGTYIGYAFERQPQVFPDVVLKALAPSTEPQIIMGIELKGWYALAKEKEPSARFKITPAACAPQDLLVVFPWALSEVISGSPELFRPHVIGARYAAEYRNWWWQHVRESENDQSIELSTVTAHYPTKSDHIADKPAHDSGSNFGRHPRTGLMDRDMENLFSNERISGITIGEWQKFLKANA